MAENLLALWNGDREAMAMAARAQALQFSWDSSMDSLFGRVYPAAFERRRKRQLGLAAGAVAAA
jgi:alpha-1,6-mannosyltransferase